MEPISFDAVSDLYDSYVSVDFDIDFFLNETEKYKETELLELMCGTGRVSIPLLDAGRQMTCVDYSAGMLDVFSQKIKGKEYDVELIQMDVTKMEIGKEFEFIFLPFHSISEILSAENQIKAFQSIDRHLTDDGEFILTLQNPRTRLKLADGKIRKMGEYFLDNRRIVITYMNEFNNQNKIVSGYQLYEIYDSKNALIETRKLDINFRPITDEELRDMINMTNLRITEIYGDYSYGTFDAKTSNFMIYKFKKARRTTPPKPQPPHASQWAGRGLATR